MITYDEVSGLMYISLKHQDDKDDNVVIKSIDIDGELTVDYDELTDKVERIEIVDSERTTYLYEAIQDFMRNGHK